jgi:hypothetical protein
MNNCDGVLQTQEELLCIADKLAEAADTVAPVRWEYLGTYLTVPPQAAEDKFILRDLALNALAHLASLANARPSLNIGATTCAQAYVAALEDPQRVTTYGGGIFSDRANGYRGDLDAGLEYTPANVAALLKPRILLSAHIARAGGRLVKDLLEKSVQADLAGAEKLRATGDLQEMWGASLRQETPYNTLRHALRLLYGRWEFEPHPTLTPPAPTASSSLTYYRSYVSKYDPMCGGYRTLSSAGGDAEDALDALGPAFANRWKDTPPSTAGHSLALSAIEAAGIVVPGTAQSSALREAVLEQLEYSAAIRQNILPGTPEYQEFTAGVRAEGLRKLMSEVSDEDIRFAIERTFGTYVLLTNGVGILSGEGYGASSSGTSGTLPDTAGLRVVTGAGLSPKLLALHGGVISGGMPREEVSRDVLATLGAAVANSKCSSSNAQVRTFQDVVAIGRQFASTLEVLESTEDSSAAEVTSLALTEVRAWAGKNTIIFQPRVPNPNDPDQSRYATVTVSFENEQWRDDVKLVYGRPWVAECAAGLRSVCPDELPANAVWQRRAAQANPNVLVFDPPGGVAPTLGTHRSKTGPELFYVVLRSEKAGKVLAAFPPRQGTFIEYQSDFRDELASQVFGIGERKVQADSCIDEGSRGLPRSYCILGMERDMFVPLANELTSAGGEVEDSWRHYLRLAEESAARADELGRQIIELGLQRDLRREAAQENLAGLCGGFATEQDLRAGQSTTSKELNACLGEPTTDVVFFGSERNASQARALVDRLVCTGSGGGRSSRAGVCDPSKLLTVDNLGFARAPATAVQESNACDNALALYRRWGSTGKFDSAGYQVLALSPEFSPATTLGVLGQLRLTEGVDGASWVLSRSGNPFMAWSALPTSEPASLGALAEYPICRTLPSSWSCNSTPGGCCSARATAIDEALGTQNRVIGAGYADYLRRTLESTLWFMGYMSGRVPQGLFSVPVPAVNFGVEEVTLAHPATIYGPFAEFDHAGSSMIREVGVERSRALFTQGDGVYGTHLTRAFAQTRAPYGPSWRQQLWNQADSWMAGGPAIPPYLLLWSENSEETFPEHPSRPQFLRAEAGNPTTWLSYEHGANSTCAPVSHDFFVDGDLRGVVQVWDNDCGKRGPRLDSLVDSHRGRARNDPLRQLYVPACRVGEGMSQECALPGSSEGRSTLGAWQEGNNDGCDHAGRNYSGYVLSRCAPADRIQLFLDVPGSKPDTLALTGALSCLLQSNRVLTVGQPPAVDSPEDVAVLAGWLEGQAQALAEAQEEMFVLNVPTRVVEYFKEGKVPHGVVGQGERGSQLLELATALHEVHDGFQTIESGLRRMSSAVRGAELGFGAAELASERELLNLAFRNAELSRQIALSTVQAVTGAVRLGAGIVDAAMLDFSTGVNAASEVAGSLVNFHYFEQQKKILDKEQQVLLAQRANELAQVVHQLSDGVGQSTEILNGGISQLRTANLKVLQVLNEIAQAQQLAAFEAAKAGGADFATMPQADGSAKVVPLPVNTVYRRQYDILQRRYERSLESARRFAYLARLSIEQRLGIRLQSLNEKIGPMEAPSLWVDDVCRMQGIDYESLRSAQPGLINNGSRTISEETIVRGFADQYIGDYVEKLKEFVEYYNIQYPFHEADDLAVLSLRDDLIYGDRACVRDSFNLLYHSHALHQHPAQEFVSEDPESVTAYAGWRKTGCSADGCIEALPGAFLDEDELNQQIQPPSGVGGASLLRMVAGPNGAPLEAEDLEQDLPPASVYQSVELVAGNRYRLSWWDMARALGGQPTAASAGYQMLVYDDEWIPVALSSFTANRSDGANTWGQRRVVEFVAYAQGTYHVAFSLDAPGSAVAIANVQLTDVAASGDITEAYEATTGTRRIAKRDCGPGDPALFRTAFTRRCEEVGGCYYELNKPIAIRASDLSGTQGGLNGVAGGNYNYRHNGVAINLVGTGVMDCQSTGQSGCYANGFVEYDLQHSAFNAGVEDYGGLNRCFSFGRGNIRHGKALAAERYLGVPLGSADAQLITGQEFMKPVFHGRPLTGTYTLRVHETPGFRWDRVEDLQLVLNYRYWARVDRSPY